MTSIGIDLGNQNTVVSAAKNKGIDTITNELSNRLTPTIIAFDKKKRLSGDDAKLQEARNQKNTISHFKRLLGKKYAGNDPEYSFCDYEIVEGEDGLVAVRVTYKDTEMVLEMKQVLAAFLSRLQKTVLSQGILEMVKPVLAVPGYYTASQRRATLEAAQIAGYTDPALINEPEAVVLCYGLIRADILTEEPKSICFVDIGHSATQLCIAKIAKGASEVVAVSTEKDLGGRDLDRALVEHIAGEIKKKHGIDVFKNKKALHRLKASCEKTKKMLTTNTAIGVAVENIGDDIDFTQIVKRETFEELASPHLAKIRAAMAALVHGAGINVDELDAVELVGGTTRVPCVKETVEAFFKMPARNSLNSEEAVSRGCAIASALRNPTIRVRDHKLTGTLANTICFEWKKTDEEGAIGSTVVFQKKTPTPATRLFTIKRKAPFVVSIVEAAEDGGKETLGTVSVEINEEEQKTVKIKARHSLDGLTEILEVYTLDTTHTEDEAGEKTEKTLQRNLPFTVETGGCSQAVLMAYREQELEMFGCDKLVELTELEKNALETSIYGLRGDLTGKHAAYATEKEAKELGALLDKTEEWFFADEGQDALKSKYCEKRTEMEKYSGVFEKRIETIEKREMAVRDLMAAIAASEEKTNTIDEKYQHITPEERKTVAEKCCENALWIQEATKKQSTLSPWDTPVLTAEMINKEKSALLELCRAVMGKPKPEEEIPELIEDEKETADKDEETVENE
ncbi:MAG: heat shock protein Hsp88 [Amphiamblys sp. WSBS2006]|nr:MAG: heat shock protein Hsp88 [Amphiamblys sp. WSBS2006]